MQLRLPSNFNTKKMPEDRNDDLGIERLHTIAQRHGLSVECLCRAYNSQHGMCFATGYPLSDQDDDGWYSIDAVPYKPHSPLTGDNVRLVCSMVARMKPDRMTWEQFAHICNSIAENLCLDD